MHRTPTRTAVKRSSSLPIKTVARTPSLPCIGDCGGDGEVSIDDLMKGVAIALGTLPIDDCATFDADGDGQITIAELIVGVNNALNGCRLLAAH